jgi:hypothetical protein
MKYLLTKNSKTLMMVEYSLFGGELLVRLNFGSSFGGALHLSHSFLFSSRALLPVDADLAMQ